MSKESDDALTQVGGITVAMILVAAMLVPILLYRGWIIMNLWRWFMVPIFGMAELGIAQSIGLSLVFGVLIGTGANKSSNDTKYWASALLGPLLLLAIGYVVKGYL